MAGSVIVVPLCGFVPGPHHGHWYDMAEIFNNFREGIPAHIGISIERKGSWTWDQLSPNFRKDLFSLKYHHLVNSLDLAIRPITIEYRKTAGETLRAAFKDVEGEAKRVCHLVVGMDREDKGRALGKSIKENPEIHGLPKGAFHEVTLALAARDRQISGTALRQAAADGDRNKFSSILGIGTQNGLTEHLFNETAWAIKKGLLKIHR